ncbi:MAG: hypothetical protein JO250_12350 [Armatimonadetes bacterium]|nr:hypothetical protein [Armatimonadota bacterium]
MPPNTGAPNSGGYTALTLAALAVAAMTADERAILSGVNAERAQRGLPALSPDDGLAGVARAAVVSQNEAALSGPFVVLSPGSQGDAAYNVPSGPTAGDHPVRFIPGVLADLGQSADDARYSQYSNLMHIAITGNWQGLDDDWSRLSGTESALVSDPSLTRAGAGLVDTGQTVTNFLGTFHVLHWAIVAAR